MPACTSKTSRVHDLCVAEAHGTFSLLITNTVNCLVVSWLLGGTAKREHRRSFLLEEEDENIDRSC